MRSVSTVVVFSFCACLAFGAQELKSQPKPADKTPAKNDKKEKSEKAEPVEGRKTKKIEGFTFLISEEALKADASVYERPPLEVLEYECNLLTKTLSPKAVDLLRQLTIFVDWDEQVMLSNGRMGRALATYYGGNAQQQIKEGRHPLQAKTVTIHSLKLLTTQRQPKNDTRLSCLLLHEFAHAIHDQLFGFDHAGIKGAYEQAMERQLYEKDSYAATNSREFFAELSCAYIDRLAYYPHNRADLKKHDPVTYKLMETLWSGAAVSKVSTTPLPHSEKASLDLTLAKDVKLDPQVAGPSVTPESLKGKIVVIGYWGGDFTNVLNRMERLQTELGDYGLVMIGACGVKADDDVIKAKAEERSPHVAVVRLAYVREDGGPQLKTQPLGHALVFDPDGKCVHRGSAYDIDDAVHAAIGKHLLTTALGSEEVPKPFKPVADAFAAGASPTAALAKVTPLTNSQDTAIKDPAKKLADLILAPGRKSLSNAQASTKTDPVGAFYIAEKLASQYKGTSIGTKATDLVAKLKIDKMVATELKARALAHQVTQIGNKLRGQEGSINPNESAFQNKYKASFEQLKSLMDQLRKQYPNSRATTEAEKIAREYKIP